MNPFFLSRCVFSRHAGAAIAIACLLAPVSASGAERNAATAAETENRLLESAKYLASDELEGRGVGDKGLNLAADYIAAEFRKIGLKTDLFDGQPFQKFEMVTGAKLGKQNTAELVGPGGQRIKLRLKSDFTPMGVGGSGEMDLPIVFAGYGITAKDLDYDDFAGVDIKGKAVIIVRKEPQQGNPHSKFDGTKNSKHAPFERKISNAYQNGAAAVILVEDEFGRQATIKRDRERLEKFIKALEVARAKAGDTPDKDARAAITKLEQRIKATRRQLDSAQDPMLSFGSAGLSNRGRDIPVLAVRRSAIDRMLKAALADDLAALETQIDKGPKPHSAAVTGFRLVGKISVERTMAQVKNVVGVLEGAGPLADETVIVGAHYDHLGFGGSGSFVPNKHVIHNGADDNASGSAALIEVAREIVAFGKPKRRIVFIAFTGEERGLLGSAHYVNHPLYKLKNAVAMLNMDMVGRLKNEKLIIQGVDTAKEFGPLIDKLNEEGAFHVVRKTGGTGPSDHQSFYLKNIPVMHFFTDLHSDYHRPTDDYDKLNVPGMRRISRMVAEAAWDIANAPRRPSFVKVAASEFRGGGGDRPYLGSIPDFGGEGVGYKLSGVAKGSPAEKGGMRAGDAIIKLDKYKIGGLEDIDGALRKFKEGEKVKFTVLRDGKEVVLEVTLGEPR